MTTKAMYAGPLLEEERWIAGLRVAVKIVEDGKAILECGDECWEFASPTQALAAWFTPNDVPQGWTRYFYKNQ